ncbi:MAG: Ig-like domain-containing protein [Thermoplasmata archaeon]|nr:MAG: Ig-like domain-containing protein [Thermoplasmata archaeon]
MNYKSLLGIILVSLFLVTATFGIMGFSPAQNDNENQSDSGKILKAEGPTSYEAAVKGHITLASNGDPISGVYVGVERDSGGYYTFTTNSGYYCLNITDGDWDLQINKSGYSGYGAEITLDPHEVLTLDKELAVDSTPPEINQFEVSLTEAVSAHRPAVVEFAFTEEYYQTVEVSFTRIFERSEGMMTTNSMIIYTNSNDHPPVHAREIALDEGTSPGSYSGRIEWNAASTGYKIYQEGGLEEGAQYPDGVFVPADNRHGDGYSMIMGIYTKENYQNQIIGAVFIQDNQVSEFYYMGSGDQSQVDLEDPTSRLQFATFYMTTAEDFTSGGPPEWGYMLMTNPIPVSDIILVPHEVVPSGDYIVSLRVEDWGSEEDDFRYTEISVDTDAPVADAGGPYKTKQGFEIQLDASESYDDHSGIKEYTWKIEPDTKEGPESVNAITLHGEKPKITLEDIGKYSVTLEVTDQGHNSDSDTATLIVKDGIAPEAVEIEGKTVYAGEKVLFDSWGSTDNVKIVKYTWTIQGEKPVVLEGAETHYTFEHVRNYTVVLNVSDAEGNWDTSTTWVNVIPVPPKDTTPPAVIESKLDPAKDATGVSLEPVIEIPFTEALAIKTLGLELYYVNSEEITKFIEGTIEYNEDTYVVKYTPAEALNYETIYKLKLSVSDLHENWLENYVLSFTTVAAPDYDCDSIPDSEDTDDDNDGMPDLWEEEYDMDPYNASDAELDTDGDGLSNKEEYTAGTDPELEDTDSDGLPDDWEVKYDLDATDPTDAAQDDDKDGMSNIDEYKIGSNPTIPESEAGDKSKQEDSDTWTYLILGIVIAVVIVLLVYTLFMKKQKPAKDLGKPERPDEEPGTRDKRPRKAVRQKKALKNGGNNKMPVKKGSPPSIKKH